MNHKKVRHNYIREKYLKLCRNFKKQFVFKPRNRRVIWRFMSKAVNDELVNITKYKFQLITCKTCKKIKKSSVTNKRTCHRCLSDLPMQRERSCLSWASWANIA